MSHSAPFLHPHVQNRAGSFCMPIALLIYSVNVHQAQPQPSLYLYLKQGSLQGELMSFYLLISTLTQIFLLSLGSSLFSSHLHRYGFCSSFQQAILIHSLPQLFLKCPSLVEHRLVVSFCSWAQSRHKLV